MNKKTILDLEPGALVDETVLVRVDYNVPLSDGSVADDSRIRATLPTLASLTDRGARLILLSHLGRPEGKPDPALSLRPVAEHLSELMEAPVSFSPETVGDAVSDRVGSLERGEILLLENTRFLPGETTNDRELAGQMGSLARLFVNDAFGTAHRAHASTVGAAEAIRSRGGEAVAGLLMDRELSFLGTALQAPERPFVAVIGGAKISGKIDVIHSLLPRVDRLLLGGAMANTFFLALGLEVGESLVEPDRTDMARDLMGEAGDRLMLPVDCTVAHDAAPDVPVRSVARSEVASADRILDIGPSTRQLYEEELARASTIVWNGPMGVFEIAPFAEGTLAVARAAAEATDGGAVSILGGGDSAAAADAAGVTDRLTHVSTGGGASLEFLAGTPLPGVEALNDKEEAA